MLGGWLLHTPFGSALPPHFLQTLEERCCQTSSSRLSNDDAETLREDLVGTRGSDAEASGAARDRQSRRAAIFRRLEEWIMTAPLLEMALTASIGRVATSEE